MSEKTGAFRFTYFTEKYKETCDFYTTKLGFGLKHAWDRNEDDRGSLFKAGGGLIEILLTPSSEEHKISGSDYRAP